MASTVKVNRPNRLSEEESLTTFEDWRINLEFYLSQESKFLKLLKPETTWVKTSSGTAHRGLESAEELSSLNQFLGVIAGLSPPLLHGDIINDTTKLTDVYALLRSYYQFAPSESTFIKFSYMKREMVNGVLERPLHLYLRLRQFIRDNLLLTTGRIKHDGKVPTTDESLTPTIERLIVLRWLEILHPMLPHHVANIFAHDLQMTSLKDLQPRICDQIDDLLRHVENKPNNDVDAQFTRMSFGNRNPSTYRSYPSYNKRRPPPFKKQVIFREVIIFLKGQYSTTNVNRFVSQNVKHANLPVNHFLGMIFESAQI